MDVDKAAMQRGIGRQYIQLAQKCQEYDAGAALFYAMSAAIVLRGLYPDGEQAEEMAGDMAAESYERFERTLAKRGLSTTDANRKALLEEHSPVGGRAHDLVKRSVMFGRWFEESGGNPLHLLDRLVDYVKGTRSMEAATFYEVTQRALLLSFDTSRPYPAVCQLMRDSVEAVIQLDPAHAEVPALISLRMKLETLQLLAVAAE